MELLLWLIVTVMLLVFTIIILAAVCDQLSKLKLENSYLKNQNSKLRNYMCIGCKDFDINVTCCVNCVMNKIINED